MEINEANIMAVTQDKKTKESNIPSIETDVPQAEETVEIQPPKMGKQPTYMNGAKLYLTFTAILFCTFLVNVEITIVSTSLVTIANDFNSFDRIIWVVTAYQVTYTCSHMVWGKISDVFGRKWPLLLALSIFIIFSGACGASQSIFQLIVFRAFQGVGAAGVFVVATVMIYEIVPKKKLPMFGGLAFAVVALATVIGPLLGGAVAFHTNWRWIFLLNLPVGFLAFFMLLIAMPAKFPHHTVDSSWFSECAALLSSGGSDQQFLTLFKKLDYIGAILVLTASFTLVIPLLQSSVVFNWRSAEIIVLLTLSGCFWIFFFAWEWYLSTKYNSGIREPIFPWRFAHNRPFLGILLTGFLVGIPMSTLSIFLPQRFQAFNEDTPVQAGLHLLPFSLAIPIGSFLGNGLAATIIIPAIGSIFAGSLIELLGASLFVTIPTSKHITHTMYAYESVLGLGTGLVFSSLMLATPQSIEARDLAAATGSLIQFRMMGSTIAVALTGSLIDSFMTTHLRNYSSQDQLRAVLRDISVISTFQEGTQDIIRGFFGDVYHLMFKGILGVAAVQVFAVALLWRRPQLMLS